MVVEQHPAEVHPRVFQLLAEGESPVVAGLQQDEIRPGKVGQKLGKVPEIPGIDQLFPLGGQHEGEALPPLSEGGLPQVQVVGGLHPEALLLEEAVLHQVGLQGEHGLVVALAAQEHFIHPVEHLQVRQVDVDGPSRHALLVFWGEGAQLPQVPQQVGQAPHVVHVGVGDEDAAGAQLVDAQQVRAVSAVLPRVQEIEAAAGLQGQAGVVAARHGLGARAAAQDVKFHVVSSSSFLAMARAAWAGVRPSVRIFSVSMAWYRGRRSRLRW